MPSLTRREFAFGAALIAATPGLAAPRRIGANLQFTDGSASTGWMDFDFYQESRIFLPVQVNGVSVSALLDSGASHIVLDNAFSQRVGVIADRNFSAHGLGGSTAGRVGRQPVVTRFGNVTLASPTPVLLDMSGLSRLFGRALNMLLGRQLFEDLLVDIDFPSRKIAFHDPNRFSPPAGSVAIPLRKSGGVRTIPISIEGRQPVQGTFDLGSGGTIDLSPRYAQDHKLLDARRTTTTMSAGIEGRSLNTMTMLDNVSMGGIRLGPLPATVYREWSNDRRAIPVPAQLGIQLFTRFRIITDYKGDRLWLVPNEATLAQPFRKDRAGLGMAPHADHLEVIHVRRGSPAERERFREGDAIVAVQGRGIDPDYLNGPRQFWMNGPAGSTVDLTMRDGSVRSLTLEDYF